MSTIRVDSSQFDAVQEALESTLVGSRRDHLVAVIERELRAAVDRAFRGRVDPATGAPWAPRVTDVPWPMLRKTGKMRREIIAQVKRGKINLWATFAASEDPAVARRTFVHFYGRKRRTRKKGGRGGGPMPARRMVGLSRSQIRSIEVAARALINKATRG